jgi:hypothetical protein
MRPLQKELLPAVDLVSSPEGNALQQALPFRLTGSQAKTAFALRQNVERMINGRANRRLIEVEYPCGEETKRMKVYASHNPENLNCTGFLTLTMGDFDEDGKFQQVWDAAEASRRVNNLNRRVLKDLFEKAIIVTERHKNGAIHFHIVGILAGRPDIRTGFNFDAVRNRNYSSVSDSLRAVWQHLREVLPKYGFGRAELTPIESTGEAIACYVSKYIEKNICNRLKEDYRKKLVRYIGFEKTQLKPNEFAWATKRAVAWRWKARECAALIDVKTPEEAKIALGPRWAYNLTWIWKRNGDDLCNFVQWTSDYTADAAEEILTKFCSVEWQLHRMAIRLLPGWDQSQEEIDKREDFNEAILRPDYQSAVF